MKLEYENKKEDGEKGRNRTRRFGIMILKKKKKIRNIIN